MNCWVGKRVFVTGAGGFVGSHLAERLVREGAAVRALVHYNALGSRGWLDHSPLARDMEIVAGDVRDADSFQHAMGGVDVVFSLAALVGIPYSYRSPDSYIETNLKGTMHVLQVAQSCGVGRIVHTSTSECYGSAITVPMSESHPIQAQSPYSASKAAADALVRSFHLSFGVPVVTVRPFNTFGPRQSQRAVIPTIISQCLAGECVRLGNTQSTRDMNYVDNTVDGFLLAGSVPGIEGQVINLGSGREISVARLAALIIELTGTNPGIIEETERLRPPGSEVDRLCCDASLARSLLGWEPRVSLEDGLRRTIEWWREQPVSERAAVYAV